MKIELHSLKCVKLLTKDGWDALKAETLVIALTDLDIRNIYDKQEVTIMLNEAVQRVFDEESKRREEESKRCQEECKRNLDERLRAEARADKNLELLAQRFEAERHETHREAVISRRWMVGTVITCTIALAGYLSALLHMPH